ncbi:MAG: hypothetical protein A2Y10_12805 [Planctomycetes bacterium GWF2_41_51]|nr:MAG: hypothetical protein A2Y10_12805 [Planctomycetes bacterium GWF2_41_51]HBG27297.1 hypothetical protein [Phycisphaerales bacterium]
MNKENDNAVKQRLLDAGEELFAEFGFNGTSSRQLTQKAGCNIASINYYFGGKNELYLEVLGRKMRYLRDIRLERINAKISEKGDELTLEDLVAVFANAFIEPLVKDAGGRNFLKLFSWEMLNPQFPKQKLVEDIKPIIDLMSVNMMKVCPGLTQEKAVLSITSIAGQLFHCLHINNIFSEIKDESFAAFGFERRIQHVIEFSSAAIRGISSKDNG